MQAMTIGGEDFRPCHEQLAVIGQAGDGLDAALADVFGNPGAAAIAGGGGINDLIVDLQVRCPLKFDVITIHEKAVPLMGTKDAPGETQPYVLVAEQECARMNVLLTEIMRSLEELQKGLAGQLNMTVMMEELASALIINQVPGRNPFHKASWEKLAWASMKSLSSWFPDMILRCEALTRWSDKLVRPFSLWLPGLFNPTSYNTAIMQVTARSHGQPLDKMSVETHVSNMRSQEEAQRRHRPRRHLRLRDRARHRGAARAAPRRARADRRRLRRRPRSAPRRRASLSRHLPQRGKGPAHRKAGTGEGGARGPGLGRT